MGLSVWWYYTGPITRALVIIGIVALALLILIAINPIAPNPASNALINALHLTRTQVVKVPVYINRTVYVNNTVVRYVNQTVVKYVNQTVPVYINRTVVVPQYVSGFTVYNNTGTCHLWSLVLTNGTIWTVGYWIPSNWMWNAIMSNTTIWLEQFSGVPYGKQYYVEFYVLGVFPGLGTAYLNGMQWLINVPNQAPSNWTNVVILGDVMGEPIMYFWRDYFAVDNGDAVMFNTWSQLLMSTNYTLIVLPVNRTYSMILVLTTTGTLAPTYAVPCNWTLIGPVSPAIAMNLTSPIPNWVFDEWHYVFYDQFTGWHAYDNTWGWLVWDATPQPIPMNYTQFENP